MDIFPANRFDNLRIFQISDQMGSSVPTSEDSYESDTEMDESVEEAYKELKSGKHHVKLLDGTFTCPYCQKKKKQNYLYRDLLQHASGVGNSPSDKRSAKQKITHLALAKFLEKDLAGGVGPSEPAGEEKAPAPVVSCDNDDKFVWPWIGIAVNLPTTQTEDGRFAGGSGSKFRDELISRGFNPTRVRPLWNYRGHSGTAVVEFNKGWPGLHNALSFEQAYEADRHGKKDWYAKSDEKSGIYAWVARADDYNSATIVGEHLRKIGDLKSISEIMEEEARKQDRLVSNLTSIIEVKNKHLEEMEVKFKETSNSIDALMAEKDRLHQTYNEGISWSDCLLY